LPSAGRFATFADGDELHGDEAQSRDLRAGRLPAPSGVLTDGILQDNEARVGGGVVAAVGLHGAAVKRVVVWERDPETRLLLETNLAENLAIPWEIRAC
jgi:hypothetical protein